MRWLIVSGLALGLMVGCSDDPGGGDGGGLDGSASADGSTAGADGSVPGADGSVPGADGSVPGADGSVPGADGSTPAGPIMCQTHLYECGNGLDDDMDGLTDDQDPDCLGPCDNNEAGYYLNIPGGDSAPCRLDCYFDQDEGSGGPGGNDGCEWDHRCDPLEPDPDPLCSYTDPPPASASCPDMQAPRCGEVCGPLVPNGCDCFGCCNLPAGGDRWVFIGSVDATGTPTCTLDDASDDTACHPCTPVDACLNPCGECEICLGRPEPPAGCFPGLTDGGVPPPVDAGPEPDGGFPDAGPPPVPMCSDGRQTCGISGLPDCPTGSFCLTGCCTFFG